MEKYRQEVEEMREELQESNLTFNHKIAVQERNALANWMKARYWETRMMQQSRENACLKYRLRMMQREMLPVGSVRRELMPGRPESQKPVWQASRVVPRMNSSTSPQSNPEMHTEKCTLFTQEPPPAPLEIFNFVLPPKAVDALRHVMKALFQVLCRTPDTPISSAVSVAMDSPCGV
ncbi:transport and Golgi organization protein 1 homolog [Mustela putorius furo]|uniref:Transport and Golgi organization protein 1 homolog n=1 Tax=Mustela putorius furo TaxID=9669 RepID=A0A8U0S1Z8_MUSPF|nr:transport and Golgi organization protein 1 homolog [Mustela putorius furo]